MIQHQATLAYPKPLARQAVVRYWWRSIGLGYVVALLLSAASLAYLLFRGNASSAVGALATVVTLGIAIPAMLFVSLDRKIRRTLRNMGDPRATLTATETTLSLASGAGTTTVAWNAVSEVRQFRTFWILRLFDADFVTLPLADTSAELRAFMLQRIREAGGRIT